MGPIVSAEAVIQWASCHGLEMRQRLKGDHGGWRPVMAPVALGPARWPAELYEQACRVQPLFNKLILAIANEKTWLMELCTRLGQHDPFVAKLSSLWAATTPPKIRAGILRSDYLLHRSMVAASDSAAGPTLKQVELNTIAASFPFLADKVAEMHHELGWPAIKENCATRQIVSGIQAAIHLYRQQTRQSREQACVVLVVVQPDEANCFDQQGLLAQLKETAAPMSSLVIHRITLAELGSRCRCDGENLFLDDSPNPVAVVYFRAGYAPEEYHGEAEWTGRALAEAASNAIKIPDLAMHLAGLKKVQQELTREEVLCRFLPSDAERAQVRRTFVRILGLEATDEGDRNAARALQDPHQWVVKPQREGGGNNIYGADIVDFLQGEASRSTRAGHILMELIDSPVEECTLLRDGHAWSGPSISELGLYGVILYSAPDQQIVLNQAAGYLVRTKPASVREGGVAAGYAYLNSLQLV